MRAGKVGTTLWHSSFGWGYNTEQRADRLTRLRRAPSRRPGKRMTTRIDYTSLEWEQLRRLPWIVAGGSLAICQPWGIGKLSGYVAIPIAVRSSAKLFPNTSLVQDLLVWSVSPAGSAQLDPPSRSLRREQIRDYLLEQGRQVTAILANKSAHAEATDYKRWVLTAAERVAQVARGDGCLFLRFFTPHPAEAYPAWFHDLTVTLELPA